MAKPSEVLTPEAMDKVLQMIESGMSQAQVAKEFQVSTPSLNAYLNNDTYAERSARARVASAEAWLDKGLEAIEASMSKSSGMDPHAARAYAQECARRAAIRNPRYSDRQTIEHTVKRDESLSNAELEAIATRGRGVEGKGEGGE